MRASTFKIGVAIGVVVLIVLMGVIVLFQSRWSTRPVIPVPATFPPTAIALPTPVGGGLIAFESDQAGNFNVYLMQGDGSKQTRLTHTTDSHSDSGSAWSSDGQRLAFFSSQTQHREVFILDLEQAVRYPDSLNQIQLTDETQWDEADRSKWTQALRWPSPLAWSPDGKQLAAVRSIDNSLGDTIGSQIYLINSDGSGGLNQYRWAESHMSLSVVEAGASVAPPLGGGFCASPQWSPDGTRLAFLHADDSGDDIFVMATDGSGLTNVSQTGESFVSLFAWSPDGRYMAYFAGRQQPDNSLVTGLRLANMATGKQETILELTSTISIVSYTALAWSPDGARLLFTSTNTNGRDQSLYLVYWDGSSLTRLADDLPWRSSASWSPDGNWVAFVSARDGNDEIYAMNVSEAFRDPESLQAIRLTHNSGSDRNPQWQPPQP